MLKALDTRGREVLGWDAQRGQTYCCPECGAGLVFKAGMLVTPHFAHGAGSACPLATGESPRHMEMKHQVAKIFPPALFEIQAAPGRWADLVLGDKIVVECQASPIAVDEWIARTKEYNAAGRLVLWVWDLRRLGVDDEEPAFWLVDSEREYRVPADVRYCHQVSYGHLYVLDSDGDLRACHLDRASERLIDWDEAPYSGYTPKTLKHLVFTPTPLRPQLLRNGKANLSLCQLGEGVWWKVDKEGWPRS